MGYNGSMSKADALALLAAEMEQDESLPLTNESSLVFGEGSPDAAVLFIGEAPGFHEDRLRRPFVGTAGKLLDKLIGEIGWKREDVYITNIVKRRPPENRDPLPEEIEAYRPYLTRQIEIISPKAIVPLGRYGTNYFLPEAKISRDQGRLFKVEGRAIIPMLHPAAALRAGAMMEMLRQSFHKLPEMIQNLDTPVLSATPENSSRQDETPKPQSALF